MKNGPRLKWVPEYSNLKHLKVLRKHTNKSLRQLGSENLYVRPGGAGSSDIGGFLKVKRAPGGPSEMTVRVPSLTCIFLRLGKRKVRNTGLAKKSV